MPTFFFSLVGFCYNLCDKYYPCQNGGSCLKEGDGLKRCYCTPDWIGPHCNTPRGENGENSYDAIARKEHSCASGTGNPTLILTVYAHLLRAHNLCPKERTIRKWW